MFDEFIGLSVVEWLQTVRDSAPSFIDSFMLFVSSQAVYMFIPIIIGAFLFWFVDKRAGELIALTVFSASTLSQFLKDLIAQPRPWILDDKIVPSEEALKHAGGDSMPSGHTTVSAGAYGAIALWFGRSWKAVFCVVIIALIAFSRLYLGVHTPADIILGFIVALSALFVNRKALEYSERDDRSYCVVTAAYLVFSVLLSVAAVIVSEDLREDFALSISMLSGFIIGRHVEHFFVGYEIPKVGASRSVPYSLMGLIPVALLLLVPAKIIGEVPGALIGGFIGSLWMVLIYPMILKRVFS